MGIRTRVFNIMIGLFFLGTLAQCGGEASKSSKAEVTVVPGKPMVISAPITVKGKVIAAPWFNFQVSMKNGSDEPITLMAIELEITGTNSSGVPDVRKVAFAAGSFNYSLSLNDEINIECNFANFGTWAPGEEKRFELSGAQGICHDPDNDGSPDPLYPLFYVDSNPSGPTGRNFNYRVKMKPIGYFGTPDEPTNRFEKTVFFSTR